MKALELSAEHSKRTIAHAILFVFSVLRSVDGATTSRRLPLRKDMTVADYEYFDKGYLTSSAYRYARDYVYDTYGGGSYGYQQKTEQTFRSHEYIYPGGRGVCVEVEVKRLSCRIAQSNGLLLVHVQRLPDELERAECEF